MFEAICWWERPEWAAGRRHHPRWVPSDGSDPILVSIPRDLYTTNPCTGVNDRINSTLVVSRVRHRERAVGAGRAAVHRIQVDHLVEPISTGLPASSIPRAGSSYAWRRRPVTRRPISSWLPGVTRQTVNWPWPGRGPDHRGAARRRLAGRGRQRLHSAAEAARAAIQGGGQGGLVLLARVVHRRRREIADAVKLDAGVLYHRGIGHRPAVPGATARRCPACRSPSPTIGRSLGRRCSFPRRPSMRRWPRCTRRRHAERGRRHSVV